MTIRFACRCGKKMKTSDDKIGKKVLCPSCGSPVVVPDSNTVAVETLTPSAAPGIGASDIASDLLRSTATDSPPTKKTGRRKQFGFDEGTEGESVVSTYETIRYFSVSFVPAVLVSIGVVLAAYWVSSALIGGAEKPPDLGYVSGTIRLDDKPLIGATVSFEPRTSRDREDIHRLAPAEGRTDENGTYVLHYTRDYDGAPVGKNVVKISAHARATGRQLIPHRYNGESTLIRDVESGSNTFDFDLRSDPPE